MKFKNLGRSGLKMSVLGLGGWITFGESVRDQSDVKAIVVGAYDRLVPKEAFGVHR